MRIGKVKNPSQAAKTLQNITNQTICTKTLHCQLKKLHMKAVVKKKRPLLTARHRRARLEFAERHLEWTVEDWKRVWWSDETKINCLGSDGRTYVWIEADEGLWVREGRGCWEGWPGKELDESDALLVGNNHVASKMGQERSRGMCHWACRDGWRGQYHHTLTPHLKTYNLEMENERQQDWVT